MTLSKNNNNNNTHIQHSLTFFFSDKLIDAVQHHAIQLSKDFLAFQLTHFIYKTGDNYRLYNAHTKLDQIIETFHNAISIFNQ